MRESQDLLDEMIILLRKRMNELKELSIESFVKFVEQRQREIAQLFSLPNIQVRRLDPKAVKTLLEVVKQGEGGQFIFRHGEQDPGSTILGYDEINKKIIMMQRTHNEDDPITISSAIEFIGTLLTLAYLKEKTGYEVQIESSPNRRAQQPAKTLADTLNISFTLPIIWACINYPEDTQLDRSLLDAKGNLEWKREKVDAIVGAGSFDRITDGIKEILNTPIPSKIIKIIITHTQQLDVFYMEASGATSAERLSNYGFIYRSSGSVLRFENGFYNKELLDLKYEATRSLGKAS
ncbi:MAG: hypothetical protein JSS53_07450 [Proteobacteria bacterium]|nr:hypothetical protein [Pseudomonadota bacterium]